MDIATPFDGLPKKVLEASKKHLTVVKNEQDMVYYKEWLAHPEKWRLPPVSFDTFLNNKTYLGIGDKVYPTVRQTGNDIIDGKFKEGVILAGIGCHALGTGILMTNGKIKKVENIKVGDKLLGYDSLPRKVLGLYRGKDKMYKITPTKGESFVVNENHILSLMDNKHKVFNISIKEYLSDKSSSKYKLWQSPCIQFKKKKLNINPYFVGLWLGCNEDTYFKGYEYGNKHIPLKYKTGDKLQREKLLAGIIDSENCIYKNKIIYYNKNKEVCQDVVFIAKSLGIDAYIENNNVIIPNITQDIYRLLNYKDIKNIQYNEMVLKDFTVEYIGIDNYYGFSVNKDNLYLMSDFIVTHNSGKTFLSTTIACYFTHILLCKRDPFRQYGIAKDKPISIMNMGTTATQALEVAFAGIKGFIQESQWFKRFHPNIIQGKIKFLDENIMLISGNSKSTTPLGYNVFCAILDEAAFYLDNDNQQVAKDIYTSLQRRIVSRFGKDGLILMVSSPKYEDDFIMQKIEEAKRNSKIIYWKQMPTWKSKPLKNADLENCFYFNHADSKIVEVDVVKQKKDINFVFSSNFGTDYKIWQIPGEYRSSFEQDPDKAKRDYAAMPSRVIEGFFKHRDVVERIFDDRKNPVVVDFGIIRYEFAEAPLRTEYFIHIDLALNRGGRGDAAGLALGHCAGMRKDEMTGEEKKLVVIDLVERITAGPSGEIDFEDIRSKIYTLAGIGYNIRMISLDGFQSAEFFQILKKKGYRAEYLSVDRTTEPYDMLKVVINEDRLRVHKQPKLLKELLELELVKSGKIDHPANGGKDLADSLCGTVFNVIKYGGSGLGMKAIKYYNNNYEPLPSDPALMTNAQKEAYYRKLQGLIDDGMLGY